MPDEETETKVVEETTKKDAKKKETVEETTTVRDEYAVLLPDMTSTIKRGFDSFQETTPGRELNRSSLYLATRYGTLVETNAKGVPVVLSTGTEIDAQGNVKIQRFFIGERAEASTKNKAIKTVDLAGSDTIVQDFKAISAAFPLLEQTIDESKKKGEEIQKKIDEENEEYWAPFYEGAVEITENYDVKPDVDLNLMKDLVAQTRQVLKRELGSKFKEANVRLFKLTETGQFAASDGSKYDVVMPRVAFTVDVSTKSGNRAFRAVRGCGGNIEDILKFSYPDKTVTEIVNHIALKVANEVKDMDRAQDAVTAVGSSDDVPIIMSSSVSGVLAHEMLGHCSEADIILANKRNEKADLNLKTRIGGQVSENNKFSMIDDGGVNIMVGKKEMKYCWGAVVVDEHGTPAKATTLVDSGVQVGVMTDCYSYNEILDGLKGDVAKRLTESGLTGNVRAERFESKPLVRMSNTFILPDDAGPDSIKEMAKKMPNNKKGIVVLSCMGGWVEPDSGDFMVTCNLGYLVENGIVTDKPVKNINISGNIAKFGSTIKSIGSAKTMTHKFSGMCGKNGQWVPVDGGGPIIYLEKVKLARSSGFSFVDTLKEYIKQYKEKLMRQRDDVFIEPLSEFIAKNHNRVNMVSAILPGREEIDVLTGTSLHTDFMLDDKNRLIDLKNVFD